MAHFVGLDVSVKETSVCVVDDTGKVILEQKIPTEPDDIIALLTSLGVSFGRIGIEAGPLSQWLVNALTAAELPVICVETRHMKALLTAQQINKTDRNDARGIAQMMRVGLFKPVHVKTLIAQEQRMSCHFDHRSQAKLVSASRSPVGVSTCAARCRNVRRLKVGGCFSGGRSRRRSGWRARRGLSSACPPRSPSLAAQRAAGSCVSSSPSCTRSLLDIKRMVRIRPGVPPADEHSRCWRSSNIMPAISLVRRLSVTAFIPVVGKRSLLRGAIVMATRSL